MIGERLKHYEVEETLGKGGMGVVYRARDTRLMRPVALKVLKSELTGDPDRRQRFLREARSACAVTHPAIAQIYDVDDVDGVTFIAMELVEGNTVRQLIDNKAIDLQGAVDVALQVSEGLTRAHEAGIVHRDIKPDNIMVNKDGHAKILDFGLAKPLEKDRDEEEEHTSAIETLALTQAGMVLGTISYMSPEQARGQPVDRRSDVFSLGIVLYEMVTGELPFQGSSPLDTMHAIAYEEVRPVTVIRKHLPVDLHHIVSRCLRKQPDDRYPDAGALAVDLKALKRDIESGVQRPMSSAHRLQDALAWLQSISPQGWGWSVIIGASLVLVIWLLRTQVDMGAIIGFGLMGLCTYRFVRGRRRRAIRRFMGRAQKLPEVMAIRVRDGHITIFTEQANARVYVRINNLAESMNSKMFFGDPAKAEVRDDLSPDELQQVLRETGILYVRKDVLDS